MLGRPRACSDGARETRALAVGQVGGREAPSASQPGALVKAVAVRITRAPRAGAGGTEPTARVAPREVAASARPTAPEGCEKEATAPPAAAYPSRVPHGTTGPAGSAAREEAPPTLPRALFVGATRQAAV